MGVHWAMNAAKEFDNQIEVIDLRTLNPVDEDAVFEAVRKHGKCMVLTEEPVMNSFAQALAGRISEVCFQDLDAPVTTMGAVSLPAVPLNTGLEATMLPSAAKVAARLTQLLEA
jgi:2-oxoisovalerate dehydrogenase E1 component